MTREDLEKLGLTENQVDGVMKLKSNAINVNENELITLKQKIKELEEDKTSLTKQIGDANKEIQSYKEMDIDGIKESATNWETKYNDLVKEQKEAKEKSIREERTNAFFNEVKFASESAKAGVIAQFNAKDFKYDEETQKFQGASEWLEELKTKDTGAFLSDVANPRFTTKPTAPTQGFNEIKNNVSLNSKFKNFN